MCRWTRRRIPPTLEALAKAQALAAGASDKERGFIEAVAARYTDDASADRAPLNAAFADKMAALSDKYPDDLELAVAGGRGRHGHAALGLLGARRQGAQGPRRPTS